MTDLEQELREHKVKLLLNEPKAMAKQRLMDFAASLPTDVEGDYDSEDNYVVTRVGSQVTYDELIERARNFQEDGEYWSEGGRFEGCYPYDGFWDDYALVTELPVKDTYGFFSCSC